MDLAEANAAILRAMIPKLIAASGCDSALGDESRRCDDLRSAEAHRLDRRESSAAAQCSTARVSLLIAQRLKSPCRTSRVHRGEHGDSEIPLWSSATIANIRCMNGRHASRKLSVFDRTDIFQNVKTAAAQVIAGRRDELPIGLSTASILERS